MKPNRLNEHYSELTKLHYRYRSAFEKKATNLLDEVSKSEIIKSQFEFLGDFYEKNKREKNYHLFPLPVFQIEGRDFQEVVKNLAGPLFTDDLLERFDSTTKLYGVHFLNNFYFLCKIFNIEKLDMNLVLGMDHSQAIDRSVIDQLDPFTFDFIFQGISQKRVIGIVLSAKEMEVFDIFQLIDQAPNTDALKRLIPKNARTFGEIHDVFNRYIMQRRHTNRALEQKINYLHGKKILDYEIEVPTSSHDLYDTCKLLDHAFTYYVDKVINGDSQILNLIKDGKKLYTVELIPTPDGPRVNRFKAMKNENSMEGSLAHALRENLTRLITEQL